MVDGGDGQASGQALQQEEGGNIYPLVDGKILPGKSTWGESIEAVSKQSKKKRARSVEDL